MQGGGTTITTLPSSSRCGKTCFDLKCNSCEVCDYSMNLCVPAENLGLTCTCDNCYDNVPPDTQAGVLARLATALKVMPRNMLREVTLEKGVSADQEKQVIFT